MVYKKVWQCIFLCNSLILIASNPDLPADDQNPPSYKYSYKIGQNDDGSSSHGKHETREGEFAHGRYYVNLPKRGSKSHVRYFADDWGYHPVVQYSTTNGHSMVSAQFALGEQAVKALQEEQKANGNYSHSNFVAPFKPQQESNRNSVQPITLITPTPIEVSLPEATTIEPQVPLQPEILPQPELQLQPQILLQPEIPFQSEIPLQPPFDNNIPIGNYQLQPQQVPFPPQFRQQFLVHSQTSNGPVYLPLIFQTVPQEEIQTNQVVPEEQKPEESADIRLRYNRLVQNTKHLVSGDDVLSINSAVEIDNDDIVRNLTDDSNRERQGNALREPIVVADLSEDAKLLETRPVSSKFLAPITAALRLKNAGENIENLINYDDTVEIQKSIPFYIGQFETTEKTIPSRIEYFESQKVQKNDTDDFQEEGSQKVDQLIKIEEKLKIKYIDRPVPVIQTVEKIVPKVVPYPIPVGVTKILPMKFIEKQVEVPKFVERPYPVYFPYPFQYPKLSKQAYNLRYMNEYVGPVPPLMDSVTARRNAQINRKNFGRNLRIEYGFKPPMQPSVETDEHGNPLHKENTK